MNEVFSDLIQLSHFAAAGMLLAGISMLIARRVYSLEFVRARRESAAKSSAQ